MRRYPMLRDRRPEVYGPLSSTDEVARDLPARGPAWDTQVAESEEALTG